MYISIQSYDKCYNADAMLKLSTEQKGILEQLLSWFNTKNKPPYITLGGYAGTGKTTLIAHLRKKIFKQKKNLKVAFVSYTGKAARVLQNKLIAEKALQEKDFVGTIHALMYSPVVDEYEEIVGWEKRDIIQADLIIVDEASMVDKDIWYDLLSYNVPIIAVGDHGQLPPIRGNFNLMEEPFLKLEQIHRQSADNPIIQLSIRAREDGFIPKKIFSPNVKKIDKTLPESQEDIEELLRDFNEETLVLCGYNNTRVKLNNYIRKAKGFHVPVPQTNDRVICLRNNHTKQIYNGMVGTIKDIGKAKKNWYFVEIDFDDDEKLYSGFIYTHQFNSPTPINHTKDRAKLKDGDIFDFGYALTVHKAQGSESKRVVLFEERFRQMDDDMWRRWLYTAVTRAVEEIYIIG